MKKIVFILTALLVSAVFSWQEEATPLSPESELADARSFILTKFTVEDAPYIYCFTTYALPTNELRTDCENALQKTLNSVASIRSQGHVYKAKRVPGSKTLWWVDARDFGWEEDDLGEVNRIQPYFLKPVVSQPGAQVFRADWFVVYTTDTTKVADRGGKEFPHYTLLYGKGKAPKDAEEFRQFWKVDIKTIRAEGIERGTIVEAGDSGVSQHTRQLRRARTLYGYYWETRDVKSHDIDPDKFKSRDFVEDIFANQADAGEYIASHKNGAQVYFLTNGNNGGFKRVEDADVGIVVDRQDAHDPRVRTAKGCMVCHAGGIIPSTNAVKELYQLGGDILTKDKKIKRAIEAFYLGNLESLVKQDNLIYETFVKECNGLDPFEDGKAYKRVYDWYVSKLSIEQAALECGLKVEDYKKKISVTTGGRLTRLFHGRGVPRDIWDSVNSGGYIQSMLLIKGMPLEEPKQEKKIVFEEAFVVFDHAPVLDENDKVLVYYGVGIRCKILAEEGEYFRIETDNGPSRVGRIKKAHVKP